MTFVNAVHHGEGKDDNNQPVVCHFCNTLIVDNEQTADLRTRFVNVCSDLTRELCERVSAIQKDVPEDGEASGEMKRVGRVNAEIWERLTQLKEASAVALEVNTTLPPYDTTPLSHPRQLFNPNPNHSMAGNRCPQRCVSRSCKKGSKRAESLIQSSFRRRWGEGGQSGENGEKSRGK